MHVDGSHCGFGYILYAEAVEDGTMVGLGSKSVENDLSSSYLCELKGLCWTLEETKGLV